MGTLSSRAGHGDPLAKAIMTIAGAEGLPRAFRLTACDGMHSNYSHHSQKSYETRVGSGSLCEYSCHSQHSCEVVSLSYKEWNTRVRAETQTVTLWER